MGCAAQKYEIDIIFTDSGKDRFVVMAKSMYDAYEKALQHAVLLKKHINSYCIVKKNNDFFPP